MKQVHHSSDGLLFPSLRWTSVNAPLSYPWVIHVEDTVLWYGSNLGWGEGTDDTLRDQVCAIKGQSTKSAVIAHRHKAIRQRGL